MIALTPPSVIDAMRDPAIVGSTRRMYDWCLLYLDWQQHRPVKASVLPRRMADTLPELVRLGYLDHRARPAHEPQHYRLLWSRATAERAA